MTNLLNHWLEAAASHFASQIEKLKLFREQAIYSEYWVQSELATLLPWNGPGIFLVDCGPALALPAGVNKYPDFSIRFGTATDQPLYFIELKDLITNSSANVKKLRFETAVMAKTDRSATCERWLNYKGKVASHGLAMIEALRFADIVYAGLGLGPKSAVPTEMPGFKPSRYEVDDEWVLSLFELQDPLMAMDDSIEIGDGEDLDSISEPITISNELQILIHRSAIHCGRSRSQTALESPCTNTYEAKLLVAEIERMLASDEHQSSDQLRHVKPWVWRSESMGDALTDAGQEYGVEIRFSYHRKPVRP